MLNEQNKTKQLNRKDSNKLRWLPFIAFPVPLMYYLYNTLSQGIV